MTVAAVVGINWGDEGKGRVVDYLAPQADVVMRFQGGNNAGHTVINEYGTFKLHLLPSGVFNPNALNILGPGMIVDLERLVEELTNISGHSFAAPNIAVSDRATIVFPFHRLLDNLEEDRLADQQHGSTRRGVAPAYGDRYWKKAVQVGALLYPEHLYEYLQQVVDWANLLLVRIYDHEPVQLSDVWDWLRTYGNRIKPLITDVQATVRQAIAENKRIILEGQLGALRDIHYGMYPFVTSSSCLSSFARIGGSLHEQPIDQIIGVMKAYSSVIGQGPFVTELKDNTGDRLREQGAEFGTATGRPRRMGWFDAVASRYGVITQAATELFLTKLDVLSGMPELAICTAYEIDGQPSDRYPLLGGLEKARPIYEWVTGWSEDISDVRQFADLPAAAQSYVHRLEALVECPITHISVGPERGAMIKR